MTRPLAGLLPPEWRSSALAAIKGIHTALFLSIGAALVLTLWDGVSGRPRQRTAVAGAIVLGETAIYVSNNQICPLTPLAEELGAERGSVVDMFLPAWAARRIPVVAGSAALLALVLNASALAQSTKQLWASHWTLAGRSGHAARGEHDHRPYPRVSSRRQPA